MGCLKLTYQITESPLYVSANNFGSSQKEVLECTHFELRAFDSKIGRWMIPDPYRQYWSPYLGMGNNPVYLTDPNGGCAGDDADCIQAAQSAGFTSQGDISAFLNIDILVLGSRSFDGIQAVRGSDRLTVGDFMDMQRQLRNVEALVATFNPDNVSAVLALQFAGSNLKSPQTASNLTARTLAKSFDDLTQGLTKVSTKQGAKFINASGNIREAVSQLQRGGFKTTVTESNKIIMRSVHSGERIIIRQSKSGSFNGFDTITRSGSNGKNQSIFFPNSKL